ncbi:cytochrome P450 [Nonomuraea sp. FMUSA5-5]|uniref:Cytochrome P450 n=1 Tax=Nonomuraea composti TaxID=2720023 RepID=A0ABX1BAG2_9ACTN|nr:cytochrome P450 [Nonomuraea sp. FMUSA5-5]NJP92776.1 cytochrome P450 [Nonomuraea sp. FMUSA5-5]
MLIIALVGLAGLVSLPWWLPARVVALRVRVFERINGDEGIPVPGDLVGVEQFEEVYAHPAAGGRSKGAALSDLFWYWLSPGPEMHQEHLEAGDTYDAVARTTRRLLAVRRTEAEELARRCAGRALRDVRGLVRLRDLMIPMWAEFSYELVFGEPCPREARDLIAANAEDVAGALQCTRLRHMGRRDRLTAYLMRNLHRVRVPLPEGLTPRQQAYYLHGAFCTTAVVQLSEAMAHLLLVLARHPEVQERARTGDDAYLDQVMAETLRLYPLFGIAHRVTTGDIALDGRATIPAGSVLCFNYPAFHHAGCADPDRFDPDRFAGPGAKRLHHIPFGVAANRPCPAWRLAPIVMRVVTREVLGRYLLDSSVSHTRAMPHRGPCLLTPRGAPHRPGPALAYLRVRDRCEDVWRSLAQLVLGTYMVWDARRLRLCERHFSSSETFGPEPEGSHARHRTGHRP